MVRLTARILGLIWLIESDPRTGNQGGWFNGQLCAPFEKVSNLYLRVKWKLLCVLALIWKEKPSWSSSLHVGGMLHFIHRSACLVVLLVCEGGQVMVKH